jgi:uncharacterized protein YdiU (UPF0061 family)
MEAMNPEAVFSSIDHGGRYAYGNQPLIARWNLAKLAEALLPLVVADPDDRAQLEPAVAEATEVIDAFPALYRGALLQGRRAKLGLERAASADEALDIALADDWLALLHRERIDFTLAWRRLADAAAGDDTPLRALFAQPQAPDAWLARWRERCATEDAASSVVGAVGAVGVQAAAVTEAAAVARAARMREVNPFVIPRNHLVEQVLAAASQGNDLTPIERLLAAVRQPFEESPAQAPYAAPAPAEVTAAYRTFCGT